MASSTFAPMPAGSLVPAAWVGHARVSPRSAFTLMSDEQCAIIHAVTNAWTEKHANDYAVDGGMINGICDAMVDAINATNAH